MARVTFTPHLQRFLDAPTQDVAATTVAQVLAQVFAQNPRLRGYVLDERGAVRQHVTIFVNDAPVRDRIALSDAVDAASEIYVLQALSGGSPDMPSLWVATRKGLFQFQSANGWRIPTPSFLGDPVSMVLDDSRDGAVYAALNLGHFGSKLQCSLDRGATWHERAVPAYIDMPADPLPPDAPEGTPPPQPPTLKQIWSLEPGGPNQPGRLWAGTLPGGLFRSDDGGQSWALVQSLWDVPERTNWFGGGYDWPGIHSVSVDPRNANHVLVGVSCGGAWATEDDGATWQCRAKGMFAEYMPPARREDPSIQDPHRIVACRAQPDALWTQHHNGVFRSTDRGREWTHVPGAQPSGFGFAVAVHPTDPDTAWFVPAIKDERRVPVDARLVVSRTRDGGRSFEVLDRGLPSPSYDLIYRHALDVAPSGQMLAMGSTTGGLWLSEDAGESWRTLSTNLPPIYAVRFAN
jgi:hypothetical protein